VTFGTAMASTQRRSRKASVENEIATLDSVASVEEWLSTLELSEYWPAFEKAGYDDLDTVMDLTEAEIRDDISIAKPGACAQLKQPPPACCYCCSVRGSVHRGTRSTRCACGVRCTSGGRCSRPPVRVPTIPGAPPRAGAGCHLCCRQHNARQLAPPLRSAR